MNDKSQMKFKKSSEQDKKFIHECLQNYNAPFMSNYSDCSFHIEEDGKIIAGIVAVSTADTLEIDYLYVEESHRGKGVGSMILSEIEARAEKAGIHRILLNTYSFQAPDFYRKNGYEEILEINPCFDQYSQHYFIKKLKDFY